MGVYTVTLLSWLSPHACPPAFLSKEARSHGEEEEGGEEGSGPGAAPHAHGGISKSRGWGAGGLAGSYRLGVKAQDQLVVNGEKRALLSSAL